MSWFVIIVLCSRFVSAAIGTEQGHWRLALRNTSSAQATQDGDGPGGEDAPETRLEKEEVRFSRSCAGKWNAWSHCHRRCWKERNFTLTQNINCPYYALGEGDTEYEICDGGLCPLKRGHMQSGYMKMIRTTMFRHGLNTGRLQVLGQLFGDFQIVIQMAIVGCVVCISLVRHLDLDWMPDMAVAIPVAASIGFFVRYSFYGVSFGPAMEEFVGIIFSRLMNDVLLPISLFEGAYHCQQLNFYSQFGTGVFFAVFGTLYSAVMIACMVKKTGDWGLHTITSWRESFAYSAFMADVDPVATLSIFSKLRVDPMLASVVVGEATLNDPIALIMFGVCNAHNKVLSFTIGEEGLKAFLLLAGSIAFGSFLGLVLTLCIRFLRISGKGPMETGYVFQCAYFSFIVGEALNMSGIIVTLFCGLVMGLWTDELVQDKDSVNCFISNAARVADMIMFTMMGFCWMLIDQWEGVTLGLWTILFCIIARAIMIVTLVPIVNVWKRWIGSGTQTISKEVAFMMWHSGFRGGMTVMMALMLDSYWMEDRYNKGTLVNGTIVSVTGMCFLTGCTGPFFLRLMNVPMQVDEPDGSLEMLKRSFLQRSGREVRRWIVGPTRLQRFASAPAGLDRNKASIVSQKEGSSSLSLSNSMKNSFDVSHGTRR